MGGTSPNTDQREGFEARQTEQGSRKIVLFLLPFSSLFKQQNRGLFFINLVAINEMEKIVLSA